mmetsp:Transcript_22696/g.52977  ORF Transcript_22696/g.52977 Transcript_22696/m.52977 type:complete len:304 (+) Transcript_22696:79-990(+)
MALVTIPECWQEDDWHTETEASTHIDASPRRAAMMAVAKDWRALGSLAEEWRNDREVVSFAVSQCGAALRYASIDLQGDLTVVEKALCCNGLALQHVSQELRASRDMVLLAVSSCGISLRYAAGHLRDDPDVVMVAVSKSGHALKYASTKLQCDPAIVMAAVSESGHSLQFAAAELRSCHDIVVAAVANSAHSLQFASRDIRANSQTMDQVFKIMPPGFVVIKFNMLSGTSCTIVHDMSNRSVVHIAQLEQQLGITRKDIINADLYFGLRRVSLVHIHRWPGLKSDSINEIQIVLQGQSASPS